MVLNGSVTYKEDIPTGSKLMFQLDFTITMLMRCMKNGYMRKRVQFENQAHEMKKSYSKHIRKLPAKKDCFVYSKRTKH